MLSALSLLALVGMVVPNGVPDPVTYEKCECYEYKIFCKNPADMTEGKSDWETSDKYCKEVYEGVGLATIDKKSTWFGIKDALQAVKMHKGQNLKKCANYGFWIGFADRRDPKPNRHKTHPEFFTWGYEMCSYFERWAPKEPNDNETQDPNGQNCVQLWYRAKNAGRYDDEYCSKPKGFVCQKKIDCDCGE